MEKETVYAYGEAVKAFGKDAVESLMKSPYREDPIFLSTAPSDVTDMVLVSEERHEAEGTGSVAAVWYFDEDECRAWESADFDDRTLPWDKEHVTFRLIQ